MPDRPDPQFACPMPVSCSIMLGNDLATIVRNAKGRIPLVYPYVVPHGCPNVFGESTIIEYYLVLAQCTNKFIPLCFITVQICTVVSVEENNNNIKRVRDENKTLRSW